MFPKENLEFLLDLIRTKGIAFPLDKCAIAAVTEQMLLQALRAANEPLPSPPTPNA